MINALASPLDVSRSIQFHCNNFTQVCYSNTRGVFTNMCYFTTPHPPKLHPNKLCTYHIVVVMLHNGMDVMSDVKSRVTLSHF